MKRITLFALSLVGACGRTDAPPQPRPEGASTGPQRIVSQTVLSDEVLHDLGPAVRGRVAGISRMADDPRYSPVAGKWPEQVPRVASTAEALLAVGPDLVIVAGFTAAETKHMLEQAQVEMVTIERLDGFDDYRHDVRLLAKAVGDVESGEALIGRFDARLEKIEAARSPSRPAVLSWNDGSIAGGGTTFDDAARAAGFENLAGQQGIEGHTQVSLEKLVAWDPPYIVIPCGEVACEKAEQNFRERPGVAEVRAVRDGRVIGIESPILYSTGADMLDLAQTLQDRKQEDG